MATQVTISTRNVGQSFGVVGIVKYVSNGRIIHETDIKPFGFDSAAHKAAKDWAEEHGYAEALADTQ